MNEYINFNGLFTYEAGLHWPVVCAVIILTLPLNLKFGIMCFSYDAMLLQFKKTYLFKIFIRKMKKANRDDGRV